MTEIVSSLVKSLEELRAARPSTYQVLEQVAVQLDRFSRQSLNPSVVEKRGSALSESLDAVLRIAILLLETVDTGSSGLDDELAKELRGTYEKYLGTFKA